MHRDRSKELLNLAGGITGFGVTLIFGGWLFIQSDPQSQNFASWLMWTVMDAVVVALAWRAGDKRPLLYIGWTMAASVVTAVLWLNGAQLRFGATEAICANAVVIACALWLTNAWGLGLVACGLAMFIAGIPQVVSFWDTPAVATWWFWVGTGVACLFSIAGSPSLRAVQNAPAFLSLVYQALVLFVLFR